MSRQDESRQRGSAVLELPLIVGFILIPLAVLVITIPTWIERQAAARDGAAEAARALVLSGGDAASVDLVLASVEFGYQLPTGSLRVTDATAAIGVGGEVLVTVEVDVPAVIIPIFGGVGTTTFSSTHRERFPDYAATPK